MILWEWLPTVLACDHLEQISVYSRNRNLAKNSDNLSNTIPLFCDYSVIFWRRVLTPRLGTTTLLRVYMQSFIPNNTSPYNMYKNVIQNIVNILILSCFWQKTLHTGLKWSHDDTLKMKTHKTLLIVLLNWKGTENAWVLGAIIRLWSDDWWHMRFRFNTMWL